MGVYIFPKVRLPFLITLISYGWQHYDCMNILPFSAYSHPRIRVNYFSTQATGVALTSQGQQKQYLAHVAYKLNLLATWAARLLHKQKTTFFILLLTPCVKGSR